jgi:hypothetical protein
MEDRMDDAMQFASIRAQSSNKKKEMEDLMGDAMQFASIRAESSKVLNSTNP